MPDVHTDPEKSPSAAAVTAALETLLRAETFGSSPRHRALLRYLVMTTQAGDAGRIRETAIALDVFDRSPADFNPADDPIVRVEMTRLRAKLARYYARDGQAERVRIEIPKGTYVPRFSVHELPSPGSEAAGAAPAAAPVPATRVRLRSRRLWFVAAAASIAIAALLFLSWRDYSSAGNAPPTVAVMPYETQKGDARLVQLGELIGDFTAVALARLPDVRVVAPASVSAALRRSPDPSEAAGLLGADHMIVGAVTRNRDEVEVVTRLVRVKDGSELVARRISVASERAIEAQVAVTSAMLAKLSRQVTAGPVAAAFAVPADPDAREKWMTARMLGARFSPQGFADALPLLAEVIAREPGFAPAYGHRATALWWSSIQRGVTLRAGTPEMRRLAEQALALDATNASAYVTLAAVATVVDYDVVRGEALYRQALRLEPGSAGAHQALAGGLLYQGRYDEALAEIQLARALSPLEISVRLVEALILGFAQRFDAADARCVDLLRAEPQNLRIVATCAYLRSLAGDHEGARAAAGQFSPRAENHPIARIVRAYASARAGDVAAAQREYRALVADGSAGDTFAFEEATLLVAMGDHEKALARLDVAFVSAEPVGVGVDPGWDGMRGEPAFRQVLQRHAPQLLAVSDQRHRQRMESGAHIPR